MIEQEPIITCVILDDEEHCINALTKQLEWSCEEVKVIKTFTSPITALKEIPLLNFDLLFLDIQMPDYNGFEVIKNLKNINFEVIFATAYDQYAIKAFKINAFDYLLKPIEEEELIKSIERIKMVKSNSERLNLETAEPIFKDLVLDRERMVAFSVTDGIEFLKLNEIIRCQAEGAYCRIFTKEKTELFISKTLRQVELMLSSNNFIRLHQSHLVNITYMKKYSRDDGHYVKLRDGSLIPVARSKKEEIKKWINNL